MDADLLVISVLIRLIRLIFACYQIGTMEQSMEQSLDFTLDECLLDFPSCSLSCAFTLVQDEM